MPEAPPPTEGTGFETLFRSEYSGVYRLAFRILGSRSEAEDVAQETFLRLHQARRSGIHAPIRPWIYRVAMNLALNAQRDRRRRRERDTRTLERLESAPDAQTDAQQELERREERAAVRRVLFDLPERQARILLLRHSGLSYLELAAAIEVAPGSVGTLLARAEEAFEQAYRRRADLDPRPSASERGDRK